MKKILKIMISDIAPNSMKSFFEALAVTVILCLFAIVSTSIFIGIAIGIAVLFGLPYDIAFVGMLSLIMIGVWVYSAYERRND